MGANFSEIAFIFLPSKAINLRFSRVDICKDDKDTANVEEMKDLDIADIYVEGADGAEDLNIYIVDANVEEWAE